jgi:preprotein translocase subunit SecG
VDGATIFIYVLSGLFFGLIAYLAVLSRRNHATAVKSDEKTPRSAA